MKYLEYLAYVLRHKWFVFWECLYVGGIPLTRALWHDMDKFLPDEFIPYARFFAARNPRSRTGYYKPTDTGDAAFDHAWFLHQKRNDHHWQWWCLPVDHSGHKVLPMTDVARREMLADWYGAGKAQGAWDTRNWYAANGDKLQLHPDTRDWVENMLRVRPPKEFFLKKHFRYLSYVLRHKWFVLKACWERGLYWQGLVHDMSKFLPSEWNAYVEHFYGDNQLAYEDDIAFQKAWNHHQKRNPHHWQYWMLVSDDGSQFTLPMPQKYRTEMLCDWMGAGAALGFGGTIADTRDWYNRNRDKMTLNPTTRMLIEHELGIPLIKM